MSELVPVLTKEEIDTSVKKLADRISEDYKGRELVLIGVLKGSFIFLADLARQISIPVTIEFVGASSYGSDSSSSGSVKITKDISIDIKNKHILLIEDIIDTGNTLANLIDYMKTAGPASVKICALIDKHERRENSVQVDYACHMVPEGFLVGYGLDYAEQYRNLPAVYHLKL